MLCLVLSCSGLCRFVCRCVWTFTFILTCVSPPQSKSASSTDSQPAEERQGPSGGYSSSQGGAEAKRRRCEDKEPLAPHSYVRAAASSSSPNATRRRHCLSARGDAAEGQAAAQRRENGPFKLLGGKKPNADLVVLLFFLTKHTKYRLHLFVCLED